MTLRGRRVDLRETRVTFGRLAIVDVLEEIGDSFGMTTSEAVINVMHVISNVGVADGFSRLAEFGF